MKIESVTARAFGPFSGDALRLAPGMNVVHGPNESGKSSWHAAIYAAICGIRRARGRARPEDQKFADLHRPWGGRAWHVSAWVVLDNGVHLEIDQRLGSGGRSSVFDRNTKRPLTEDIEREGAADVSTLLGLSRETAAATMFVRQAEILRVLGGAEALQEYLERAAATATVDTTADEALTALVALKKDKVGSLRIGSRNPITLAHRRLEEARNALETAEQQFESYQEQRARLADLSEALLEAESELTEVDNHEAERAQRERWRGIADLERQLDSARGLQAQLDSAPHEPEPDARVVEAITGVLDSLKRLPPIPPDTDEPSVEQIRNELAQLPDMPTGDLEAADAVTAAIESWRTAQSLLMSHQQGEPKLADPIVAEPQQAAAHIEELEVEIAGLLGSPDGDLEPAAAVADAMERWGRSAASLETHIEGRPEAPRTTERDHIGGSTTEELEAELARLPVVPDGDREAADSVTRLLTAWREACAGLAAHTNGRPAGPDAGGSPGELQGPSVAELEAQLSRLPTLPKGDLEPAPDAQSAFEAWNRADERVLLHAENRPEPAAAVKLPAPAGELRRLLDDLAAPMPEPAARLTAEVAGRHPQDQPAPGAASKGPLIGGALVAAFGIAILAAVQPIVGGVIVGLGLTIMVFGLVRRGRNVRLSVVASPALEEIKTEQTRQLDTRQQSLARAERARTALAAFGLLPDPTEIHRLIIASEMQAAAEATMAGWQRRDNEARQVLFDAALRFHVELASRGVHVVEGGDLRAGYDQYVQACRERAALTREAEKRDELQSRLDAQIAMEERERRRLAEAHQTVENWERQEAKLEQLSTEAAAALRQELRARGVAVEEEADPQDGYELYIAECRERARIARQGERRGELESLLETTRAFDEGARQRQTKAQAIAATWEVRRTELEEALDTAAREARAELASRGVPMGEDDNPRVGHNRYLALCQEQAGVVAGQERRRHELEKLLVAQREAHRGALQRLRESRERLDNWQVRLHGLEEDLGKRESQLRAELCARTAVAEGDDLQAAFEHYVHECRARSVVARQAGRRTELRKLLEARTAGEHSREQVVALHRKVHETIDAHAEATDTKGTTPADKANGLRRWLELQHSKEAVRARRRELEARLSQLLDGDSLDGRSQELRTKIASAGARPPHLEGLPNRTIEAKEKARFARDLRDETTSLNGQLEETETHLMDVAVALENEHRAQDEVDALATLADDLDLTTELLRAAKDKAHANIAPLLNDTLRPWIPRVTGGRYDDVQIDSTTLELRVRETHGQFRPAKDLSHGTAEQLFLLLRIALAEHLATGDEVAPLILDDVTVQADKKRTRAMLELIHELSAARQVVLFSQEAEVLAWAQAALKPDNDRLIELAPADA